MKIVALLLQLLIIGIIFYSAGNTVYRLDFVQQGGKATPIYTHEGGKVTRMKFARTRNEQTRI